jgi:hypothetical protein
LRRNLVRELHLDYGFSHEITQEDCGKIDEGMQAEPPKWGKKKVFLFLAVMIFLFVGVPLLIVLYFFHKFSHIE